MAYLLEREAPLGALGQARTQAEESGCIALVSGEAGIGKTSLVNAFAESLGERTFVAMGRCDALFTPRVLGPVHDIAARLDRGLQERLEAGEKRAAAYTAFLDALKKLSAPVIVFEDMHWADEATLDLVKFLGRRIGDTRALLVMTYRDDEVGPKHPLRMVLGELPGGLVVRIPLAPLSLEAVRTLASPTARLDPAAVHQATSGNPFYVTEILACGPHVPETVRDAVLTRAARLGSSARAVADVVSVSPGGLELSIVGECVEASDAAVAECEQGGMLRATGGVLRFRHEIARLAVLEALGETRARSLNARVLASLRTRSGDQLARLAHHAAAAGESRSACEYAIAAARRAAAMGSHREAADHYAVAVEHCDHLPERDRAELFDAYAWEGHITNRAASIPIRQRAIEIWRRTADPGREAESLARIAHTLVAFGRDAEGEVAMKRALELAAELPPGPAQLSVHRFHAYLRMLERDVDEAISAGRKALALAKQLGDVEGEINASNSIGSAMLVGDDEGGIVHLEHSLELARAHGFDYHVANATGNLGSACGEVHRFKQAIGYLEASRAWATSHDLDNSRVYATSWLALVHLFLGRWAEAGASAEAVLANPGASVISRIMALLARGRVRARRGDPGAWEALDEVLALAEGTETLQRVAPTRAARAEASWLAGEDAAAAREAAAAEELATRKRHAWFVGELLYWQWKGGRAVEMPAYAARPYALQVAGRWQEAAEDWAERGCPYEQARALAEGTTESRLEALRIFDGLGARPAAERLRHALRAAGVRRIPRGPRASTRAQPAGLTAREVQILGLVAENLTNAEIGARLHISPKTVDHHVSAVLEKLGVATRREAVRAFAK